MSEDFEGIWSDIYKRLMPGTLVRYWNEEGGYTGGAFYIEGANSAAIIVRHMGHGRQVAKPDFQRLFAFWDDYNRGNIDRATFAKLSENTTFILSILRWHDEGHISPTPPLSAPLTLRTSPVRISPQSQTALRPAGYQSYGKQVLYEATEGHAVFSGPSVEIDCGVGPPALIDATVGDIAIAIEARVSEQNRGAILDLLCHTYPKKLLVLLPDHIDNRGAAAERARNILKRFCPNDCFRVLVLKGSSSVPQLTEDASIIAAVIADLRSV